MVLGDDVHSSYQGSSGSRTVYGWWKQEVLVSGERVRARPQLRIGCRSSTRREILDHLHSGSLRKREPDVGLPRKSSQTLGTTDSYTAEPMTQFAKRVWALTSGEAGVVSQAVGLAEAVGWQFEIKTARLRAPWSLLPGHLCPLALFGLREPLSRDWPDLLITCGRRSVAVAIAIRKASGRRTFTVHVQNPQVPVRHFDLVAPPRHDGMHGKNVFSTRGALHRITPARLEAAANVWRDRLGCPTVAVLLGGDSRAHRFAPSRAEILADGLGRVNGTVVVTPSRRTSMEIVALLRRQLPRAWIWDGAGENPYLGMLALAEHIVVTEDSASMVSEAASTGKPVYVAAMDGGNARFDAFHASLREEGVTRPFDGTLASWSYEPINDTPRIAAEIRRRIG